MGCGASKAQSVAEPVVIKSIATANSQNLECQKEVEATSATVIANSAVDSLCKPESEQQLPLHLSQPGLYSDHVSSKTGQPIGSDDTEMAITMGEPASRVEGTKDTEQVSPSVAVDIAQNVQVQMEPFEEGALELISESGQQKQPDTEEGLPAGLHAKQEQVDDEYKCNTNLHSSSAFQASLQESYSECERQPWPIPLSTGGDHGIMDYVLNKSLPLESVEDINQEGEDEPPKDKSAAGTGLVVEDSDIAPKCEGDDSGEQEKNEQNPKISTETERASQIDVRASITKRSDLTEGDCFDADSSKMSNLSDTEKCSPFDSPLHYLSGDLTQLAQEAASSMKSDYKRSTPSSSGSSELDTDTYMQDLIEKIKLTKESIDLLNKQANSSTMYQDLEIGTLSSELQDIALRLQDSDNQNCAKQEAQELENDIDLQEIS